MKKKISAIVLAAGMSKRMGRPKLILPWGETTIIGQVVHVLLESGINDIVIVAGAYKGEVEKALNNFPVRFAHNPKSTSDEMTRSLQIGLEAINENTDAVLVVLGDQPQIEIKVLEKLIDSYCQSAKKLVFPSYQKRRGHPWIVDRSLWSEILILSWPDTLRGFVNEHANEIDYVVVERDTILRDIDTPEEYSRQRPE